MAGEPSGVSFTPNAALVADVDLAVAAAVGLRLAGFSFREIAATAGTAAFRILHGTIATGTLIVAVELAPNESGREWWWPGIKVPDGLSIDWLSGTIDVVLYHVTGAA